MGATTEVMDLADMHAKLSAFEFDVMTVDGHDEVALHDSITTLKALKNGRPKGIIAQTIKGKGVSFMEGQNIWHYTRLDQETYAAASDELTATSK
jgi:transketolase